MGEAARIQPRAYGGRRSPEPIRSRKRSLPEHTQLQERALPSPPKEESKDGMGEEEVSLKKEVDTDKPERASVKAEDVPKQSKVSSSLLKFQSADRKRKRDDGAEGPKKRKKIEDSSKSSRKRKAKDSTESSRKKRPKDGDQRSRKRKDGDQRSKKRQPKDSDERAGKKRSESIKKEE